MAHQNQEKIKDAEPTQASPSNIPSSNVDDDEKESPLEVRPAGPGKGLGVFARRAIPGGAVILSEAPLLRICTPGRALAARRVLRAFEKLAADDRARFLGLHRFASASLKRTAERQLRRRWDRLAAGQRRVLATYAVNNFGSVYATGARFNHSCAPNVELDVEVDGEFKDVEGLWRTVRDVGAGEELTLSYLGPRSRSLSRERRRRKLEEGWGFACRCDKCSEG